LGGMDEKKAIAELQAAKKQLQASLDKCHELVDHYRSKLAANGNEPEGLDDGTGAAGQAEA